MIAEAMGPDVLAASVLLSIFVIVVVVLFIAWGWRWFTTGACPRCRGTVHRRAEVCPHCGYEFG